ncbi:MAG: N-glycosylase/DNA lyase [Ferroplasma sp.]|uniref:N-glycosylase/DNA lyase n=1 Tax=Ferroplasma sp. TaxID=2591003 RepID=UPI002814EB15|nr:N-glycosylase/DNA lyase [Ferroplasma sp.]WMT51537.1 MAG: N-glycosylase/DNA lyase [Ferroplasma sp.]
MIKEDELSIKIMESKIIFGKKINERAIDFINMGKSRNDSLFIELCFCILTANTSAEMGIRTQRTIMNGFIDYPEEKLRDELKAAKYRFYNKRASYIVGARPVRKNIKKLIAGMDHFSLREYLVNNIKGVGYKEASHFLRNIGIFDFAILDKHILKLMKDYGYTDNIKLGTRKDYLEKERVFNSIASVYGLAPGILDLYLWQIATGKILK